MKNPFFGPRKTLHREDFERKPDFEEGDIVVPDWMLREWKVIHKARLVKTQQLQIVHGVRSTTTGSGAVACWKCDVSFLNSETGHVSTNVPAEGYVNVTKYLGNLASNMKRNKKFGL